MRAVGEMIVLHNVNFMYLPVILRLHSSLIADAALWINRTRLCLAKRHYGIWKSWFKPKSLVLPTQLNYLNLLLHNFWINHFSGVSCFSNVASKKNSSVIFHRDSTTSQTGLKHFSSNFFKTKWPEIYLNLYTGCLMCNINYILNLAMKKNTNNV